MAIIILFEKDYSITGYALSNNIIPINEQFYLWMTDWHWMILFIPLPLTSLFSIASNQLQVQVFFTVSSSILLFRLVLLLYSAWVAGVCLEAAVLAGGGEVIVAAVSCVVPVEMMCGSMSGGPSMTCIPLEIEYLS